MWEAPELTSDASHTCQPHLPFADSLRALISLWHHCSPRYGPSLVQALVLFRSAVTTGLGTQYVCD